MVVSWGKGNIADLTVGGYIFQVVNDFKYLGTNINKSNITHNEIILRISAANKGYFALVKVFKSKLLPKSSKTNPYLSYLRPVLAYGCETWSVTKGEIVNFRKESTASNLRTYFGKRRIPNKNKREDLPNIKAFIRSKRMERAGHLWRENGIGKQVLIGTINGRRPRGRPRQRRVDTLKTDPANIAPGTES